MTQCYMVSSPTTQNKTHSDTELIKHHTMGDVGEFNFQYVSSDVILSLLNKLNIRKATGCDNIPSKLLRIGSHICDDPREHLSFRATLCIILPLCMGHREWRDPLLGR